MALTFGRLETKSLLRAYLGFGKAVEVEHARKISWGFWRKKTMRSALREMFGRWEIDLSGVEIESEV